MGTEDNNSNVNTENIPGIQDSKTQPAIRENLVRTAVEFLQKPQVQKSHADLKRNFLQSKGLTDQEISLAFEKVGTVVYDLLPENYSQPPGIPPPVPARPHVWPVQRQYGSWHWIRDVANTVTAVGGLLYSLYWIWKKIIVPYMFGKKDKPKSVEQSISDLEKGVCSSIDEIKQDLVNVKSSLDVIAAQKHNEVASHIFTSRFQEVKSEITSLKGLLLNRSQFPPTPAAAAVFSQNGGSRTIPPWQLSEAALDEAPNNKFKEEQSVEEEVVSTGFTSDGTTTNNGSDSSLEMIKE